MSKWRVRVKISPTIGIEYGFTPNWTVVSGGDDGTVRLWTLDGKAAAEPFKGHNGRVFSVAFSPDGTRIVSGGVDRTVRLWTLDGWAPKSQQNQPATSVRV